METRKTAAYLRLSQEDGDKVESDSITNQHKQLEQYLAEHPELELADYYADDGYTGTNFDRPAFRRMEADISQRKVSCVLVKDLSCFGRDHIEVGRYLEKVFPALGVRSAIHTKQQRGEFVGEFARYGYRKGPFNLNHLLSNPPAA